MKKTVISSIGLLVLIFLVSCGKADRPSGVWHEQTASGGTLEINGDKILYTSSGGYTFEEKCSFRRQGNVILIEPEDYYIYEDMSYDPARDVIVAYTMSHTDGDGGHNYIEFRREAYVTPTPIVYDPPVDNSDPEAQKVFEDMTIRSMSVSFYDEGTPPLGEDMAPEPPFADHYDYEVTVLEEGTGLLSSSFCREIELTKDQVDELQALVRENDLGSLNGLDIHTEGVPLFSPEYTLELTLASGEVIRSSANWTDVPENWKSFQTPMHHLLFFAFVDAGYNYQTGEFHSTQPMKRMYASNHTYREGTGFKAETILITPDWEKAYDYSLDTKYFSFSDPENRYPALMKTLGELSDRYKKIAEEELKKDYEMMEQVPKSVWKKADRRYCYSLYAVDQWFLDNNVFSFAVSEGHSNSLGVGDNGYGKYRTIRYFIDVDTGRILSLGDFFTDPEAIGRYIAEKMIEESGTHNERGKRIHREDFTDAVLAAVGKPEPEGIGWTAYYDKIILWMPLDMFPSESSQTFEWVYYDEIQELLGDRYTEIW